NDIAQHVRGHGDAVGLIECAAAGLGDAGPAISDNSHVFHAIASSITGAVGTSEAESETASRAGARPLSWVDHQDELASGFVVGFRSVEDALQGIEVPLCGRRAVVELGSAKLAPGFFYHGGRQLLERLTRPHGINLNLGGAFEIVKPVIGFGDSDTDRGDA